MFKFNFNFCNFLFNYCGNKNVIAFLFGIFTYYCIAVIFRNETIKEISFHDSIHHSERSKRDEFERFYGEHKYELDNYQIRWSDRHSFSHQDEDIVAKILYKNIRIFCWIMTLSSAHESKAQHVKATWAKRCNGYIFISDKTDPSLPSVDVDVIIGRDHLWQKTKNAFKYVYKNHRNDYDYFLKADDDTFVIVENLRHMVKSLNSSEPFYMGRRFRSHVKQGFMSGGSGYLLSRGALFNLIEKGIDKAKSCPSGEGGPEDVNIGLCLEAVDVRIHDSFDADRRERFHPFLPRDMLLESHMQKMPWMYSDSYYKLKFGPECCSDDSVTFHYVNAHDMYMMDFFIYHLRPFGVVRNYHEIKSTISQLEKKSYITNPINY